MTSSDKLTNPAVFKQPEDPERSRSEQLAELVVASPLRSAVTVRRYADVPDQLDITDLVAAMRVTADQVTRGDLSGGEATLAHQLLTLDVIFNHFAQRAGRQTSLKDVETLLRLSLKAQSQARTTAEALASIRSPSAIYANQIYNALGPQQINNGVMHPSCERKIENAPNKLLDIDNGKRMDSRATSATVCADPNMATVGIGNGAANRSRKAESGAQRGQRRQSSASSRSAKRSARAG